MKILFVNTHYFLPQSRGGMANTLDQLCRGLADRGHTPGVLCAFLGSRDMFGLATRARIKVAAMATGIGAAHDAALSYPVWRAWHPVDVLPALAGREQPDIIVAMGGKVVQVIDAARQTGIPLLTQVHDVEFDWHGGDFAHIADVPVVANSQFTADAYRTAFGVDAQVIYPFMPLDQYRTDTHRRVVTFVNPLLRKGFRLGVEIAALCPELPFHFVGAIPDVDETGRELDRGMLALPNLTVEPFRGDMRDVYAQTRVLLAPSQWNEAYGRVINEAQVSGIPVLASTRGGIPEAAQDGGILLPADAPAERWATALRRMWNDETLYADLCAKAVHSASRPQLQAETQLDQHECALEAAINDHRAAHLSGCQLPA
ncbi:glycosyltransferase [Croceicoccus sp. F390]|uniref:Glycosyltransferase n=1 Tax=Croceicoccus esteveae TaxID=3075597 RepID=A0ABU2ZHH2_9SPHN|nr:glycosyltransferase [Croceicoccus sp. F390]MDT0575835.1 glycosyltransferase [Croceicoccus sp. F390]